MGILDEISDREVWKYFLEDKTDRGLLSKREIREISIFVEEERYVPLADELRSFCRGRFPVPEKKEINKKGTGKKRTVYCFDRDMTMMLKLIGYLLYRYDSRIDPRCYSFRRSLSAKNAVRDIVSIKGISDMWFYKTDVHDYFNAIPPERLASVLDSIVDDDPALLAFLKGLILQNECRRGDEIITEKRGAMAGVPLSSFFADIYLKELDAKFRDTGIEYFRYSDDIIIFAPTEDMMLGGKAIIESTLQRAGLEVNPEKESSGSPGEPWEFLGFRYENGQIRLSVVSLSKIKAKIRRKARSLYRWRKRKEVDFEKTAGKMIRIFNGKFYDDSGENGFTWSRWFFPVITDPTDLREIDRYLIENIRYLRFGRHYKGNYKVTYEDIKALGFRSLYSEYYRFREARLSE